MQSSIPSHSVINFKWQIINTSYQQDQDSSERRAYSVLDIEDRRILKKKQ